jgi:hypothetical protein
MLAQEYIPALGAPEFHRRKRNDTTMTAARAVIGRRRRGIAAETPFLVLVARIMRNGQTDLFATGL